MLLPQPVALVMVITALVTATALLGFYFILGQWSVPADWAHPLGVSIAGLVLGNSLLHLFLLAEPRQTTNLILLLVGVGWFLLSMQWLALVLVATWTGWGYMIWVAPPSPEWAHFGFALLTAMVLSVLVHTARLRTYRRLETLRLQNEQGRKVLEETLQAMQQSEQALHDAQVELEQRVQERTTELIQANDILRAEVTERKRAEEALRTAQEQLLEQQRRETERVEAELARTRQQLIQQTRLAAIGQVSATIAHELRNPLGAVRNVVYLLKRRLSAGDPKVIDYLKLAEEEVHSIERVINDLMEMTRGKEPSKRLIDLTPLVQETYRHLNPPKGLRLHCALSPDPFEIWGDAMQLRQVFGNLFTNAIQAMEGEGMLSVTTSRSVDGDVIMVEDSGPGVAPEARERIFEPLVTTKAKGIGLGLTLCRQIIERHGGTLACVQNGGKGAVFCIRLPRPPMGWGHWVEPV